MKYVVIMCSESLIDYQHVTYAAWFAKTEPFERSQQTAPTMLWKPMKNRRSTVGDRILSEKGQNAANQEVEVQLENLSSKTHSPQLSCYLMMHRSLSCKLATLLWEVSLQCRILSIQNNETGYSFSPTGVADLSICVILLYRLPTYVGREQTFSKGIVVMSIKRAVKSL
jgi:hypothetical protein